MLLINLQRNVVVSIANLYNMLRNSIIDCEFNADVFRNTLCDTINNFDVIRDAFLEYAKKLCAEIGQPDLPIYAGPNRHKLIMDIFAKGEHEMEIIGNSGEQEVYVDYDANGHYVGRGEKNKIVMYKIR